MSDIIVADLNKKLKELLVSIISENYKKEDVVIEGKLTDNSANNIVTTALEFVDAIFANIEYVKAKFKSINEAVEKERLLELNKKKSDKYNLLNWQKGIKSHRKETIHSLSSIAHAIGVTKQTVSKWENGISKIPLNRAKSLSTLINYPLDI